MRPKRESWRQREWRRLVDEYTAPQWGLLMKHEDHFLHVSPSDPRLVRFTASEEDGERDVKKEMKPGRYLAKYFPQIPLITRTMYVEQYAANHEPAEFKLATTEDEIERVYLEGPESCMDGEHEFRSKIHPVRAYAGGDLAVAYLERGGRITARAVVWPEKKLYHRLYGDVIRLRSSLENAGYQRGHFEGAKLRKIPQRIDGKPYVVAPFIDGTGSARIEGDFIVLTDDDGDDNISVHSSDGVTPLYPCGSCEQAQHEDAVRERVYYHPDVSAMYCEECASRASACCDNCGKRYAAGYLYQVEGGKLMCQPCVSEGRYAWCNDCAVYTKADHKCRPRRRRYPQTTSTTSGRYTLTF